MILLSFLGGFFMGEWIAVNWLEYYWNMESQGVYPILFAIACLSVVEIMAIDEQRPKTKEQKP